MPVSECITANAHSIEAIVFRQTLIKWGKQNFRAFPWRMTRDPYKILMSEVMLHRTQAKQVVPVYEQLIQTYPDIENLLQATNEDLHTILYSLGLNWRINRIFEMGKNLKAHFDGIIPMDKADLLTLSGVSEYIAGAVRCFSWNLPEPLADTNTVRVTGRLFGLVIKDSSRRSRQFQVLLAAMVDPVNPRDYNYALLDLADKVCMKKQKPLCSQCPLKNVCLHFKQNKIL